MILSGRTKRSSLYLPVGFHRMPLASRSLSYTINGAMCVCLVVSSSLRVCSSHSTKNFFLFVNRTVFPHRIYFCGTTRFFFLFSSFYVESFSRFDIVSVSVQRIVWRVRVTSTEQYEVNLQSTNLHIASENKTNVRRFSSNSFLAFPDSTESMSLAYNCRGNDCERKLGVVKPWLLH